MKKTKPQDRPQTAQIDAIERCLRQGEIAEARQRLTRLQASFPGFKPLKRLAYEVEWHGGYDLQAVYRAWDWCEASPNSVAAFEALADSSAEEFPFLNLYALDRLVALGEEPADELPELRAELSIECGEAEGRRIDLCRVFLGVDKTAEARAQVEGIDLPAARNNVGLSYFAEGKIERAESVWEAVLETAPEDSYALERLLTTRLWLGGRALAQAQGERLLVLTAKSVDDVCRQLDGAIMLDWIERADNIYLSALNAPWTQDGRENNYLHTTGALVAWRQGKRDEALLRLGRIDDEGEVHSELRMQCALSGMTGEAPDWGIGHLPQWWPVAHIRSLHVEKFESDNQLFERWQVTMPHPDYLVAAAINGDKGASALAVAGLRYLAQSEHGDKTAAREALIALLALPCGADSVRSNLHRWLVENGLLEKDATISMRVGGTIAEVRPLELTIHNEPMEEETVLDAADQQIYGQLMDFVASRQVANARPLAEKLLSRYPDYHRVLTAAATLREADGEPIEHWAPLIRHAADVAPDYFFARTGLVKLLVREGKLEDARAEIKPLLELKEMHSSEWRSLILAQIIIAKADADLPTLKRLNAMLRDCQERFG